MLKRILQENPIIPVISVNNYDDAIEILNKLKQQNINIVEFTLRSKNALKVIKKIIKTNTGFIIGIGTITSLKLLKKCAKLKADFLVSPGSSIKLLKYASKNKLNYLAGGVTAFEIMTIMSYSFKIIKFFPAEAMGGVKVIKNYQAVFPDVSFCATGGINTNNQQDYLSQPNVLAIGSSSII